MNNNEIELNENYWDCECRSYFIHPKISIRCLECGSLQIDQPPSRENEIKILCAHAKNSKQIT